MEPQAQMQNDQNANSGIEGDQNMDNEGEESKTLTPYERKLNKVKESLAEKASRATPKKYVTKTTFQQAASDETQEIFSCEYEHEDKFISAWISDGSVCIYNLMNGKLAQTIQYVNTETNEPARAMWSKWRNTYYTNEAGNQRKQSMLLCAFSDGVINEYAAPIGKLVSTIVEENNQTFALDIDPFEEKFVSCGKDYRVRVYDLETKELISKMIPVDSSEPGHAQRVFALKYKKDDPNWVISGGWDKTLQIHDIRKGGPVGYIFGPDLCSNALDIHDNLIVTGSYRGKNPLQIWDLRKKELIQNIEWGYFDTKNENSENSYLNWAAISHSGDMIIAGGKGQEVKFFEREEMEDESTSFSNIGKQSGFKDSVMCCSFANTSTDFVVGTADGTIKIFTK